MPAGAVLIRGPSGSGKSDLALRCLTLSGSSLFPYRIDLVTDDQVLLERRDGRLHAEAPATLRGKLEVRGLGILPVAAIDRAPVLLVADLVPSKAVERLPDRGQVTLLGVVLPHLLIAPFEHSAAIKLLLALSRETPADL